MANKVYIIPCSGVGKVYGSICREATYIVVDELAKDRTATECLPLIVKGKEEVIDKIKDNKIITLDGCGAKCAFVDVSQVIRIPDASFLSTMIIKDNRDLKPEPGIYPLGENAKLLTQIFAEQIVEKVDELLK